MVDKTSWIAGAALLAAATLGSASALASTLHVQVGPPPVYQEVAPPPRRGHVWVPGHWEWQGSRHAWVAGYFVRARSGYAYQQPHWEQHGNRWAYTGGRWAYGDRDHDGIINARDRDRDGDGVPNRYDHSPDNPRRR